MARYILSDPLAQVKGSIGGATFQRSGKVLAIRKRNVPIQKRSSKQSRRKNAFDCNMKLWKTLSPTEQATWLTFQSDFPRVDSFGNSYLVNPIALQNSSNLIRTQNGLPQQNDLVAAIAFVPITTDTFVYRHSSFAFDIVILPLAVQTDCTLNVFAGIASLTQQAFTKANCRFLGSVNSGIDTNLQNWFTVWNDLFQESSAIVDGFIPLFLEVVQNDSAQVIGSWQDWATIEA